jgi:hypothetical protein
VLGERDLQREAVDSLIEQGISSADLDSLSPEEREAADAGFLRAVNSFLSRL